MIISVSGHRDYDDDAQNYVAGVSSEFGDSRETNVRWTDPAGNIKEGSCTLANIVDGGGDAGAKSTFSYEIHLNGKPTYTAKSEAAALSVTIAAGVTTGTTTATATAGTGNSLAYKLGASSYGTLYGQQYISGFTTYTSGDEIEAAEGQYLLILELDSNDRVVSYNETLLEAADIA
ncbi:MAG: hypothetical protein PQJ60_10685 [Spirochaetales bacterium]|nr:hypothetical protein [Spirochaetales bacterium]